MRTASIIFMAVLAAGVGRDVLAAGKPVFTNKPRFRIPYNYDAAEMRRLGAREIRLYVSTDRGVKWQHAQSVAPDVGKFNFQAAIDGEYWFSVRTVDAQGQLHPGDNAVEPGLEVVVDTVPPQLALTLQQTSPGRVQLAWNASDAHLDPTRLRLEFMQPGVPNWQVVGVIPKAADKTEWSVPTGGVVAVRGTVSDFAGNVGQAQSQVQIAAGGDANSAPGVPNFRDRVAEDPNSGSNQAMSLTNSYPTAAAVARDPKTTSTYPLMSSGQGPIRSTSAPTGMQTGARTTGGAMLGSSTLTSGTQVQSANPAAAASLAAERAAGRLRLVNSRRFQIGYKLQDVGPSGISGVELYMTLDNGATWSRYGEDADRQSPFVVEVPGEGAYGFAIVVHNGVGIASDAPQPGEKPSIVVSIDETAPQTELLPLEQGRGPNMNKILIQWKTFDAHPAEKPITLSYAAAPQGPWHPIATAIDDTGSHLWSVGPAVPSKFYVRLEVRDAVGNIQRLDSPEPVLMDLSRPSARIVDIEANAAPVVGPQ